MNCSSYIRYWSSCARQQIMNKRDSKVKLLMKYQKAGRPRYCMNSPSPWIENWKLMAKKKKFQIKFRPIETGDRL